MAITLEVPNAACCPFRARITDEPYRVLLSGPNQSQPESEGYFVALMDDAERHPAKRLVRSAYGPNLCTALATLENVVGQDMWLTNAVKAAAIEAINARLKEIS